MKVTKAMAKIIPPEKCYIMSVKNIELVVDFFGPIFAYIFWFYIYFDKETEFLFLPIA